MPAPKTWEDEAILPSIAPCTPSRPLPTVHARPENLGALGLSLADYELIMSPARTLHFESVRPDQERQGNGWSFDRRYEAQRILPWLWMGPWTITRDKTLLQQEDFTMVFAVRPVPAHDADPNKPHPFSGMGPSKATAELGILVEGTNFKGPLEISPEITRSIGAINKHVLHHRKNADTLKPPKVLVICETGNDRALFIVAAYIMAMFTVELIVALRYVETKRASVFFYNSEPVRRLKTWYEMLRAQEGVNCHQDSRSSPTSGPMKANGTKSKRNIDDIQDGSEADDAFNGKRDVEPDFLGETDAMALDL